MKIIMSGIDFKTASVDLRERLSFSKEMILKLDSIISHENNIDGCVILSTCNRTEIYISCDGNADIDLGRLLIEKAGFDYSAYKDRLYQFEGREAVRHIIEVGCGLKSQILGEGQIVGQINSAISLSRNVQASNSCLETLFRIAVTAGKETLTNAVIRNVPVSASCIAVKELSNFYSGSLKGRKCVVIGNGKMGRLAEELLVEIGAEVFVTIRSYKHGETIVPYGCKTVEYKNRFEEIDGCDFVISATTSPHYTVERKHIEMLKYPPQIFVDLAMPRDIEPTVGEVDGIRLMNIDDFKIDKDFNNEELKKAYDIVDKYADSYYKWENYKKSMNGCN